MIVLSVVAALVAVLFGAIAIAIRQIAVDQRDQYLEEVALTKITCADQPATAAELEAENTHGDTAPH